MEKKHWNYNVQMYCDRNLITLPNVILTLVITYYYINSKCL